jgi:hypothetical protein
METQSVINYEVSALNYHGDITISQTVPGEEITLNKYKVMCL